MENIRGKRREVIKIEDSSNIVLLPKKVCEAIDKAKKDNYTKYSMTNFTGMERDYPDLYKILNDYFFFHAEKYLKAILYNNYIAEE